MRESHPSRSVGAMPRLPGGEKLPLKANQSPASGWAKKRRDSLLVIAEASSAATGAVW